MGSSVGIVGTAALSFDLLKSKTAEESITQFKHLQDQLNNASQALTVRMNDGLSTLAGFLAGYLSFLEIEAQLKEEATGKAPNKGPDDPELEKIRQFIYGHSEVSLRHYAVGTFAEARKSLASPQDVQGALTLTEDIRGRIEGRFAEEVALSHKLRRVALMGVALVGIGAVAQLADLLCS